MSAILMFLFGVALIGAPIVAGALNHPLGALSQIVMTAAGILLAVVATFLMVMTKLYVRTKASEAFVRTGQGGLKVIQDGGAVVIPFLHEVTTISLMTFKIEVTRVDAEHALITSDKLRADVKAEFFVRVKPEKEHISAAARSFGSGMNKTEYVKSLIEDKLVSALRTVAATKTLEQLNSERDEFMKQVTDIIGPDLEHNGLTLETATISKLDQTDPKTLREDNIFDAQGMRTIAEITQAQLTDRNRLVRAGEQARAEQDLTTRKQILTYDQDRAEAEVTQLANIATVTAEQDMLAKQKGIETQKAIELSAVDKSKAVEVAERGKAQAVEVAERDKQRAIAEADAKRATAEGERAKAEAGREKEVQAIKTVEVTSAAERDMKKRVIEAQAEAERTYIQTQKAADGEAYKVNKLAEANKNAADAEAEAVTKKAAADANAKEAQARGEKAIAMVPIDVKRAEVEVDQARVADVVVPELQARQQHGEVAQQFELAKLRIEQDAHVRIETAKASAQILSKVVGEIRLFGSPDDLNRMIGSTMHGMTAGGLANGFLAGASAETKGAAADVGKQLMGLLAAVADKVGAKVEETEAPPASSTGTQTKPAANGHGPSAT